MKNINKKLIVRFILIIIWMIVIFCFSNQDANISENTSEGTTAVIIKAFTKNVEINEQQKIIDRIDPIIRKLAHYSIYLVGGIIIMNFMNLFDKTDEQKMLYSIIIGIIYATTDEIHQYFIPGRSMSILDVFIDTLGLCTGIVIFLILYNSIIKRMKNNIKSIAK